MRFDHVYSCVTRYQLLCVLLHRMAHRDGNAVLFILNLTFTEDELNRTVNAIRLLGMFDSVRIYDEKSLWNQIARETVGAADRATQASRMDSGRMEAVRLRVAAHFSDNVGDIAHRGTVWCVAADHYSFGMALVFAGIEYVQFEDHSGGFEQPHLQLNTFLRLNPFQHQVYSLMTADRVQLVRSHVVDSLSNARSLDSKPVEELHVRTTLDAMPRQDISPILTTFDFEPIMVARDGRDSVLLITQPFARWKFLTWEQQRELYYMVVDYFAPNAELVVKPHPQDDLTPYASWFPRAVVAPATVPIEIVLTSLRPALALTVGSTAIFPLRRANNTATIFLGQGFERVYDQMPRLFGLATLLNWLGIDDVACSSSFPHEALESLMGPTSTVGVGVEKTSAFVCWEEQPAESELDSFDIVASLTPILQSDPAIIESALVVRRQRHGRPYATQSLVYLYSRDANIFNQVKGSILQRTLSNLGEDLTIVFPADGDVMFLQAQVANLEARVNGLTERLRDAESGPTKKWFASSRG